MQSRPFGAESFPSYLFYRSLLATGTAHPLPPPYLPLILRIPDTVELKAGKTIDIPIEVEIREEMPTGTQLRVYTIREEKRAAGGVKVACEELPVGIRFTVIDNVKFELHQTYSLKMRIETSQGSSLGNYNFVITEIGGVTSFGAGFPVKVMPP